MVAWGGAPVVALTGLDASPTMKSEGRLSGRVVERVVGGAGSMEPNRVLAAGEKQIPPAKDACGMTMFCR